jgi:hypothetical protein
MDELQQTTFETTGVILYRDSGYLAHHTGDENYEWICDLLYNRVECLRNRDIFSITTFLRPCVGNNSMAVVCAYTIVRDPFMVRASNDFGERTWHYERSNDTKYRHFNGAKEEFRFYENDPNYDQLVKRIEALSKENTN